MARWVDATDAQRFWQYIYPAAKARIDSGHWTKSLERLKAEGIEAAQKFAAMDKAVVGVLTYGSARRNLEYLRRSYKECRISLAGDEAIIADANRRKAYRKGKNNAA